MALKKSSELRAQEHVNSRQFHIKFNGTAETCPYKVGDLYDGRSIISIGFSSNLYGHSYHLIVERDRCRDTLTSHAGLSTCLDNTLFCL